MATQVIDFKGNEVAEKMSNQPRSPTRRGLANGVGGLFTVLSTAFVNDREKRFPSATLSAEVKANCDECIR
ncbi:MAG: hypothetical protein ROZ64_07025 [Burkholderiaceae bacterium]|nr:hypothetical protein [Burkholderiaceae bacterium]